MQVLLVLAATGLLLFGGYSWGLRSTVQSGEPDTLEPRRVPGVAQVIVPALLGLGCCVAAITLQTDGGVRLLTPARLDEMQQHVHKDRFPPGSEGGDEGGARQDEGAGSQAPSPRERSASS